MIEGKLVLRGGVKLLYTAEENLVTMYHLDDIEFPKEVMGSFNVKFTANKLNRVADRLEIETKIT